MATISHSQAKKIPLEGLFDGLGPHLELGVVNG